MQQPMDILREFPVRKSKKQKKAFRAAVMPWLQGLGYRVQVERGAFGSRNVVIGDPEKAEYVITAHYDTCARMFLPNLITPCSFWGVLFYQLFLAGVILAAAALPVAVLGIFLNLRSWGRFLWSLTVVGILLSMLFGKANPSCVNDNTSGVITLLEIARSLPVLYRDRVCFVLFDLEEAGLIGSASYVKAHRKAADRQLNLNLDCVGDGDHILFFPTKMLKKDQQRSRILYFCQGNFGKKRIRIHRKGFSFYPSDQMNFPYGVGICALRKKQKLLYLGRIHTRRDTVLEVTNVNLLRAAIVSMVCCGAVK